MNCKIFKIVNCLIISVLIFWNLNSITSSVVAGDNTFTVKYYLDDNATQPSDKITTVNYGTETATLTIKELGFNIKGKVFIGWKTYRESDQCWKFVNGEDEVWAKERPEGYDYFLYNNGSTVAKTTAAGTEIRFYAQWISSDVTVTDEMFGANGNDKNDDTVAIQKALNLGKGTNEKLTVNIPKGTYYINYILNIYSNTELKLDKEATIVRQDDSNIMIAAKSELGDDVIGYNNISNITITGGTWDGNITSLDSTGGTKSTDLMLFMHGNNINVKDTVIKECCGYHFIDLIGINNATIENVTFKDYIKPSTIKDWGDEKISDISEAVQMDFVPSYQDTTSNNITVQNCNFINCCSGIGNHHLEQTTNHIKIINNTFKNMQRNCINLLAFNDVTIQDNQTENAEMFLLGIDSKNIIVKGNKIHNINDNAIYLSNSTAEINNNTLSKIKGTAAINSVDNSEINLLNNEIFDLLKNGIRVKQGKKTEIIGNTISDIDSNGIFIDLSDNVKIIKNNITNSKVNSLYLTNDKNIEVLENILMENQTGIYCNNISGEILKNKIIGNVPTAQYGIYTINNSNLKIDNNNISNMVKDGINAGAILLEISNNTINNCDRYGIRVRSGKSIIKSNSVLQNNVRDIFVYNEEGTTVEGEIIDNIIGEKGIDAANNIVQKNNTIRRFDLGDVNQDGKVDSSDAVQVLKYVAHNIELNETQLLLADTNKDGEVNSSDAVQILKYVAHNISGF